jgi:hypothetical protein
VYPVSMSIDSPDGSHGQQRAPYEHNSYLRMAKNPGIEGIWQGHLSLLDKDPAHNTSQDMIANFEETAECKGNWIKASADRRSLGGGWSAPRSQT